MPFAEMEKKIRVAPAYYQREQREFINAAKQAMMAEATGAG